MSLLQHYSLKMSTLWTAWLLVGEHICKCSFMDTLSYCARVLEQSWDFFFFLRIFLLWIILLCTEFIIGSALCFYCLFVLAVRHMISYLPESESCSVLSVSLWPHGLYRQWDSPDWNTGGGSLSFLQGSSQHRDQTQVSHIGGRFFTSRATREALISMIKFQTHTTCFGRQS